MSEPQKTTALVPTTSSKTYPITDPMYAEAVRLLKDRRLVPLAEFDAHVAALAVHVADALRVTGSGRTRRKNLVDHVKAQMTKRQLTRYLSLAGVAYIAWCPVSGAVHDEYVVDQRDVLTLLAAIESNSSR